MSRIGKKAVPVPAGVTVNVVGSERVGEGPEGRTQDGAWSSMCSPSSRTAQVKVDPRDQTKLARSCWGMSRTMIANMIKGVTEGYSRSLEINGVGYRAAVQGKSLQLNLGYSHDVSYPVPEGIEIKTPKPTEIVITGIDKQRVGQVAAEIREFRGPEPYKGKGVKYAGERIFRKEGKKK